MVNGNLELVAVITYEALQEDSDTVCTWVDINDLAMNRIKCKYMVVSRLRLRSVPSQTMLLSVWSTNASSIQLQIPWSFPY